jgi:hypothetical protein
MFITRLIDQGGKATLSCLIIRQAGANVEALTIAALHRACTPGVASDPRQCALENGKPKCASSADWHGSEEDEGASEHAEWEPGEADTLRCPSRRFPTGSPRGPAGSSARAAEWGAHGLPNESPCPSEGAPDPMKMGAVGFSLDVIVGAGWRPFSWLVS